MFTTFTLLLILAFEAGGWFCLAFSQSGPRSLFFPEPIPRPALVRRLRFTGIGLFGSALLVALWRDGAGFGILLWILSGSLIAFAIACWLAWIGHRRREKEKLEWRR